MHDCVYHAVLYTHAIPSMQLVLPCPLLDYYSGVIPNRSGGTSTEFGVGK